MASGSATTSSDGSTHLHVGSIQRRFAELQAGGKRALVPYITAGHPDIARTVALLHGLEDAGADVIELGLPFSDPMADGPIIQASSQMSLEGGMHFNRLLEMVHGANIHVPLVLFSYLNPIIAAGSDALTRAAQAGFSGLLLTDLPVGADPEREHWIAESPLAFVRLVAPTTPADRMREISEHGSGFVYLISRLGVTGMQNELSAELPATVKRLREATVLPVCVGFGVSRPEQAAAVARIADGVVVGSAIVRAAGESVAAATTLAAALRSAIDAA